MSKYFYYFKRKAIASLAWAVVFSFVLPFAADAKVKKVDLNQDGFQETQLFFEDRKITKALIDGNGDGTIDGTIYYKNGSRDKGERDINYDGKIDTWIQYYMTGIPWAIALDKNHDGKPDYWRFIKNGFIYRREWDRNFDGKADIKMIIPGKNDLRGGAEETQLFERHYDDDFDGEFERVVKIQKRVPHIQVNINPGAIGEL